MDVRLTVLQLPPLSVSTPLCNSMNLDVNHSSGSRPSSGGTKQLGEIFHPDLRRWLYYRQVYLISPCRFRLAHLFQAVPHLLLRDRPVQNIHFKIDFV